MSSFKPDTFNNNGTTTANKKSSNKNKKNAASNKKTLDKKSSSSVAHETPKVEVKKSSKPKYRILNQDEIIQKGDQAYRTWTRGWNNVTGSIGYTPGTWFKVCTHPTPCKRFRRKVI